MRRDRGERRRGREVGWESEKERKRAKSEQNMKMDAKEIRQ